MKRTIVTSGASVISTKSNESLEAFLGSCVGVTLVDRQADVGGLLHLLLDKPTGTANPFSPENYASTGMPHFLNNLIDAGASKNNLEACVAGGALIGPVSDMDLFLDIGGRTTDVVQTYLKEQEIPIKESETGGYAGRKMIFDLYNWNTTIEPTWQLEVPSASPFQTDIVFNIDEAIQRVKPIPQVALKIIRMIHQDDCTMKEIGREIRQDQVIAGRV